LAALRPAQRLLAGEDAAGAARGAALLAHWLEGGAAPGATRLAAPWDIAGLSDYRAAWTRSL
jgi:hypothetical protein